jgi:integrase
VGSNPTGPMLIFTFYLAPHTNYNGIELTSLFPSQSHLDDLNSPYYLFKYSVRSESTRKYYERRIKKFFDFIGFSLGTTTEERCNLFAQKGKIDNNWAAVHIIRFLQYEKERVEKGDITAATLRNFVKSIKLYCEMCDITIVWKKITRGLPRPRQAANDRVPTIDEIRQLIEYPDRRIKPIIYTMASSGIRIGAWDYLKWKHVTPLTSETGELVAAKILVYAGDSEEYYSFITPEAYNSLKDWIEFRSIYGEKITGESWVMRDIWQTSNMKYGAKFGLATTDFVISVD